MANINFSSFFSKGKNGQQTNNGNTNYQSPYFSQQVSQLQNMRAQQASHQNTNVQPNNMQQGTQGVQNNQQPVTNPFYVKNDDYQKEQNDFQRPVAQKVYGNVSAGSYVQNKDPNYVDSDFEKELKFLQDVNVKKNIPVKTEEEVNNKNLNVNVSENPFSVNFSEKKEHVNSFDNRDNVSHNVENQNSGFRKFDNDQQGVKSFGVKDDVFSNDQQANHFASQPKENYQDLQKNKDYSEVKPKEENRHSLNTKESFSNTNNFIQEETKQPEPVPETKQPEPVPETKQPEPVPETKQPEPVPETKQTEPVPETKQPETKEFDYINDRDVHKLEGNVEIVQLEVEKIKVNPFQPRKDFNEESIDELASSIREYGVLEPLIIRRIQKEGEELEYQLIAGERRLRASKKAGLKKVPVIYKDIKNDAIVLELALIENVQREDLSSIAKAKSYAKLIEEFGYTQEMVGSRVGKSRASIANTLRLLQLPYEAQKALGDGKITESHARALLLLPNMEKQRTLLNEILTKQLSSRESHLIAKQFVSGGPNHLSPQRTVRAFNQEDLELREMLESKFGTKVSIKRKGDSGEILIHFDSSDELNGIINKISSQSKKDIDKSVQNLM
jgi:ParB family transcriptional regulator, chromosome partitioning protein